MIVIEGTVRIPPENLERARPVMEQMIRASRAEPGCLDYALTEDPLDPGLIRVYEHFVDEAALAFHRATPNMATWRAACAALGAYGRDLSSFDVSDYRKI